MIPFVPNPIGQLGNNQVKPEFAKGHPPVKPISGHKPAHGKPRSSLVLRERDRDRITIHPGKWMFLI